MIPGKATVKRKTPEAASMSRWGQTHRWGAKSNKSMLHEWHQVTRPLELLKCLQCVSQDVSAAVNVMMEPGFGRPLAQCPHH